MPAATCGSLSAPSLGLPDAVAIPEAKGILPKAIFAGRGPISNSLRQHFIRDVASVHFLALLKPSNTGLADGTRIHDIMVLGLQMSATDAAVPIDVIDYIAAQRPNSGVLFIIARNGHASAHSSSDAANDVFDDGSGDGRNPTGGTSAATIEQCALAVRRQLPGRTGHIAQFAVHHGEWHIPSELRLALAGGDLDEAWASLCSQAILGTADHHDLDERIARRDRIQSLETQEAKLVRDHARAKDPKQRNAIFANLGKVRKELGQLRSAM